MARPRVLILRSPGINCDDETAHAFELAGGNPEKVHVNRLLENPAMLDDYAILTIPGGFSYGDDISAGRILAQQISSRLMEPMKRFVERGKPVAGICNGFQVLVKTDLLPGPGGPAGPGASHAGHPATLAHNNTGRFMCKWVTLREEPASRCLWTRGLGEVELPIAHGEGRFVTASDGVLSHLEAQGQIALRYVPAAPNGSTANIAGVCDATGLVFGLMPHPERHVRKDQHPAWTSMGTTEGEGPGLRVFRNAVELAKS